jgi:hypothetical protein
MRILKLSRFNLQQLEDELDRIGLEKHDIEPQLRTMPSPDPFDEEIGFDYGDDEDE